MAKPWWLDHPIQMVSRWRACFDPKFKSLGCSRFPLYMECIYHAMMLEGERWLNSKEGTPWRITFNETNARHTFHMLVIKARITTTILNMTCSDPPNLPEMQSIYWYPSTCFWRNSLSEGRGWKAIPDLGHPLLPKICIHSHCSKTRGIRTKMERQGLLWMEYIRHNNRGVEINGRMQLKYLIQV
jgi:hypothetical protein